MTFWNVLKGKCVCTCVCSYFVAALHKLMFWYLFHSVASTYLSILYLTFMYWKTLILLCYIDQLLNTMDLGRAEFFFKSIIFLNFQTGFETAALGQK